MTHSAHVGWLFMLMKEMGRITFVCMIERSKDPKITKLERNSLFLPVETAGDKTNSARGSVTFAFDHIDSSSASHLHVITFSSTFCFFII